MEYFNIATSVSTEYPSRISLFYYVSDHNGSHYNQNLSPLYGNFPIKQIIYFRLTTFFIFFTLDQVPGRSDRLQHSGKILALNFNSHPSLNRTYNIELTSSLTSRYVNFSNFPSYLPLVPAQAHKPWCNHFRILVPSPKLLLCSHLDPSIQLLFKDDHCNLFRILDPSPKLLFCSHLDPSTLLWFKDDIITLVPLIYLLLTYPHLRCTLDPMIYQHNEDDSDPTLRTLNYAVYQTKPRGHSFFTFLKNHSENFVVLIDFNAKLSVFLSTDIIVNLVIRVKRYLSSLSAPYRSESKNFVFLIDFIAKLSVFLSTDINVNHVIRVKRYLSSLSAPYRFKSSQSPLRNLYLYDYPPVLIIIIFNLNFLTTFMCFTMPLNCHPRRFFLPVSSHFHAYPLHPAYSQNV